jgi:hypothetical protein
MNAAEVKAKGFYIEDARFLGNKCRVKISTMIPNELAIIIEQGYNPVQYGLYINHPTKTLLPKLKKMFPKWFTYNEEDLHDTIKKLFDQVDNAVLEATPKDDYTETEKAYLSGYQEAMDFMRTEMAWIEKKLKEGESPFDYAGKK